MHPEIPFLREAIIFLVAAGLIVPLMRRAGINAALGFLFVGLVIGPFGVGRLVGDTPVLELMVFADIEGVRRFAELGVVFLLFTIGLELSGSQLWGMRGLVFGVGSAQVAISAVVIGGIAYAFGNTLVASTIDFADSYPPLVPKVTIPLCPFGKYLSAKDLYLLLSKPG